MVEEEKPRETRVNIISLLYIHIFQPKRKAPTKEQPNTKKVRIFSKLIFQKKLAKPQVGKSKAKEIQSAKRTANLAAGLMKEKNEAMVSTFIFIKIIQKKRQMEHENPKKGKFILLN